jgi:hypothetical protein
MGCRGWTGAGASLWYFWAPKWRRSVILLSSLPPSRSGKGADGKGQALCLQSLSGIDPCRRQDNATNRTQLFGQGSPGDCFEFNTGEAAAACTLLATWGLRRGRRLWTETEHMLWGRADSWGALCGSKPDTCIHATTGHRRTRWTHCRYRKTGGKSSSRSAHNPAHTSSHAHGAAHVTHRRHQARAQGLGLPARRRGVPQLEGQGSGGRQHRVAAGAGPKGQLDPHNDGGQAGERARVHVCAWVFGWVGAERLVAA